MQNWSDEVAAVARRWLMQEIGPIWQRIVPEQRDAFASIIDSLLSGKTQQELSNFLNKLNVAMSTEAGYPQIKPIYVVVELIGIEALEEKCKQHLTASSPDGRNGIERVTAFIEEVRIATEDTKLEAQRKVREEENFRQLFSALAELSASSSASTAASSSHYAASTATPAAADVTISPKIVQQQLGHGWFGHWGPGQWCELL